MRHVSASVLLLFVLSVGGATPGDIHLPQPPTPPPAPQPSEASYVLAADDYLFVGADQPCLVRVSPAGIAEWEEAEAGTHHWKVGGAKKKYKTEHKHTYQFSAVAKGKATVEFFWAEGGAVKVRTVTLDCQGARPPPVPPGPEPEPKPPEPKPPEPVTSFRVIFVYETADPLTPAMQRVMFGEKVRTLLDAATTPHPQGGKGWRRFDKDVDAANERDPELKKLWQDARPQVTAVPCVIVAVNRSAEILPFPADEAQALELFAKYAGGK